MTCSDLGCDRRGLLRRERQGKSQERKTTGNLEMFSSSIHIGSGSGDTVMKSGMHRDEIAKIDRLLDTSDCCSIIGRYEMDYGTILHAASAGGHEKIVQILRSSRDLLLMLPSALCHLPRLCRPSCPAVSVRSSRDLLLMLPSALCIMYNYCWMMGLNRWRN